MEECKGFTGDFVSLLGEHSTEPQLEAAIAETATIMMADVRKLRPSNLSIKEYAAHVAAVTNGSSHWDVEKRREKKQITLSAFCVAHKRAIVELRRDSNNHHQLFFNYDVYRPWNLADAMRCLRKAAVPQERCVIVTSHNNTLTAVRATTGPITNLRSYYIQIMVLYIEYKKE